MEELFKELDVVENDNSLVFQKLPYIKKWHDNIKMIYERIKEIAIEESKNYPSTFDKDGFTFEKRSGGRRFSFDEIQEIKEVKDKLKELEGKYKTAYTLYERGGTAIDEETGEVLQIPKVTYSKDTILIKTKKQQQ